MARRHDAVLALCLRTGTFVEDSLLIKASQPHTLISAAELPELLEDNSPGTFISNRGWQQFRRNAAACGGILGSVEFGAHDLYP